MNERPQEPYEALPALSANDDLTPAQTPEGTTPGKGLVQPMSLRWVPIPTNQREQRRWFSWITALSIAWGALLGMPRHCWAQAGSIDPGFVPDTGAVYGLHGAVGEPDGSIVVAGWFGTAGGSEMQLLRLDRTGARDPDFQPARVDSGSVEALALQADGRLLIGGYFSMVGGVSRRGIARLLHNGSLDLSFDPGSGADNGSLSAIAMQTNGQMVIAGSFTSFSGVSRRGVARLNPDGSLDSGFDVGTGPDYGPVSLALTPDGKILVAGGFDSFNGVNRMGVARLNSDGAVDPTFVPSLLPYGTVEAVATQSDGKVVVSGYSVWAQNGARGVVRLNADGSVDAAFASPQAFDYSVRRVDTLVVQEDGRVLVGGDFTDFGGVRAEGIVRLNTNGTLDVRYDPGTLGESAYVHFIVPQSDGGAVLGWTFTGGGGVSQRALVRLRGGDTSAYAGRLQFSPQFYDVGEAAGVAVIRVVRTRASTGVARINYATQDGTPHPWNPARAPFDYVAQTGMLTLTNGQTNATITVSILDDSQAEPTEQFSLTLGQPGPGTAVGFPNTAMVNILENDSAFEFAPGVYVVRESRANLNIFVRRAGLTTGAATVGYTTLSDTAVAGADFTPQSGTLSFSSGESIRQFSVPILEDNVPEGQETFRVRLRYPSGGVALGAVSNAVVAIEDNDDDGPGGWMRTLSTTLGSGSSSFIDLLAIYSDGDVLIAGWFDRVNDAARNRLARLNPDGSLDGSFDPDPTLSSSVDAVLIQADGRVVLGGSGENGLIRLNADGSIDNTFNAVLPSGQYVTALAGGDNGQLLVAGSFREIAGVSRTGLAQLQTNGAVDTSFNPVLARSNSPFGELPEVRLLAVQAGEKILIAGKFDSVNAVARQNFARLNSDGSLDTSFDPGRIASLAPNRSPWEPVIDALALQPDGKLLVAGNLTGVRGLHGPGVVRLNGDGSLDSSFAPVEVGSAYYGFDSSIRLLMLQPHGKALLAGNFDMVQGLRRSSLARLNADGSLDVGFDAAPSFTSLYVSAMAVETTGDILVAGSLQTVDGTAPPLVRLRNDNPNGFGRFEFSQAEFSAWETSGVATITVERRAGAPAPGTVHYAAADSTATNGLDYVLAPGSLQFSPGETTKTFTVTVYSDGLVEFPEQLTLSLQAGNGAVLGSQTNATLTIYDHPGGLVDESFDPGAGPNGVVGLHWLPGERILLHGYFNAVDGVPRRYLARLNPDGSLDQGFDTQWGEYDQVLRVAVNGDGKVYVNTGSQLHPYASLTRLLPDGSPDLEFQVSSTGHILAMVIQPDGKPILSHMFPSEGAVSLTNRLLRLSVDGSQDLSFHPSFVIDDANPYGGASQLVLQADGKLLVGGGFSSIAGVSRRNVARLNPDGSVDLGFAAPELQCYPELLVLQTDGRIVVAGAIATDVSLRYGVCRLHSDGSLDPSLQVLFEFYEGLPALQTLLVQSDQKVIVGGLGFYRPGPDEWTSISLLRLGPTGAIDLSFASDLKTSSALLQGDGRVIVAGDNSLVRLLNDADVGAGRVEFDAASFEVSEGGGPTVTLTVRRTMASQGAISVNYGTSGTTTPGADFSPGGGTVRFEDGETTPKTITLQIHDDTLAEGPETMRVMLGTPIGGVTLGAQSFVEITILDEDVAVELAAPVYRVYESDLQAVVPVRRLGATNTTLSVEFFTVPGTATAGVDFHPQNCTLQFALGQVDNVIYIPLIDDGVAESNETFRVVLRGPTGGALLGTNSEATVVIVDNDRPGTVDARFEPDPALALGSFFGSACVNALTLEPDGRILIGGALADSSTQMYFALARLTPDGMLDGSFALVGVTNGLLGYTEATALARQADGRVLVGLRNIPRGVPGPPGAKARLMRVLQDGTLDESFRAVIEGEFIGAIGARPDGRILIGGAFLQVNGASRNSIARLLSDGSLDAAFNPDAGLSPLEFRARVTALTLQPDAKILIGGWFSRVNSVTRRGIARLDPDGAMDYTFDPGRGLTDESGAGGEADALLVQPDGRVLVGGFFSQANGFPRLGLARLLPDGSVDLSFDAGRIVCVSSAGPMAVAPSIMALALQPDGKVLVGGSFAQINNVDGVGLARLNADGSLDLGFRPGLGELGAGESEVGCLWASVLALAIQPDGQVLVGGQFFFADGLLRPGLARLNGGVFWVEFQSLMRLASGRVRLNLAMPRGQSWFLEASDDLHNWFILNPTRPLRDSTEFTDITATGVERRFYRGVQSP